MLGILRSSTRHVRHMWWKSQGFTPPLAEESEHTPRMMEWDTTMRHPTGRDVVAHIVVAKVFGRWCWRAKFDDSAFFKIRRTQELERTLRQRIREINNYFAALEPLLAASA